MYHRYTILCGLWNPLKQLVTASLMSLAPLLNVMVTTLPNRVRPPFAIASFLTFIIKPRTWARGLWKNLPLLSTLERKALFIPPSTEDDLHSGILIVPCDVQQTKLLQRTRSSHLGCDWWQLIFPWSFGAAEFRALGARVMQGGRRRRGEDGLFV